MSVSLQIKDQNGAYAYKYEGDAPTAVSAKTLTATPWMTVIFQGDPGSYTLQKNNNSITAIGKEATFTLAGPPLPLAGVLCEVIDKTNQDVVRMVINTSDITVTNLDSPFVATLDDENLREGVLFKFTGAITYGHVLKISQMGMLN
jgi:hypothetical protein